MKISGQLLSILLLASNTGAFAAGNAEQGKALHDKNCMGCHDTKIYTRPDRIIHGFGDLKNRVRFCESNNGLDWNTKQIEDVSTYLDKAFYKF